MKILVTGHLGFVGTETVRSIQSVMEDEATGEIKDWVYKDKLERYLKSAHEVIGYDLMDGKDIRDIDQLDRFVNFHKAEYEPVRILHLAAIARFSEADENPIRAYETNVLGTQNVVEVADKYHIPLVYASTGSAIMPLDSYEAPYKEDIPARGNSVYGTSKALGEYYVQRSNSPWIILRYSHLYGKEKRHHGLVGGFIERIERGLEPKLHGGQQTNDFLYVKDVAKANRLALEATWDKWNQTYHIGTGRELTAKEAGQAVCHVMGYKGKIEVTEARTVDPGRFCFDVSKAKEMLGFEAEYTFEAGLKDMVNN